VVDPDVEDFAGGVMDEMAARGNLSRIDLKCHGRIN